jgi:hypothetical protein
MVMVLREMDTAPNCLFRLLEVSRIGGTAERIDKSRYIGTYETKFPEPCFRYNRLRDAERAKSGRVLCIVLV